jgi:hypothetical protein
MTSTRITRPIAIGAALAATVAGGGSALALSGSQASTNVYRGCLNHQGGALYNVHVNPATAPTCRTQDRLVSWNQSGPAGPRGATGPSGTADLRYAEHAGNVTVKNDIGRASIVSLALPAGSWRVQGQVVAMDTLSANVLADCLIAEPDGTSVEKLQSSQAITTVPVNGYSTLSPQQVVTVPKGQTTTMTLTCFDLDSPPASPVDSITFYDSSLTAISATRTTAA